MQDVTSPTPTFVVVTKSSFSIYPSSSYHSTCVYGLRLDGPFTTLPYHISMTTGNTYRINTLREIVKSFTNDPVILYPPSIVNSPKGEGFTYDENFAHHVVAISTWWLQYPLVHKQSPLVHLSINNLHLSITAIIVYANCQQVTEQFTSLSQRRSLFTT